MEKCNFISLSLALISLASLAACKQTPQYPELSASLADSLIQTDIPGVFISGVKSVQPRVVQDVAKFCPRLCATKTYYGAYVFYPVTICHIPDFPTNNQAFATRKVKDSLDLLLTKPVTHMVSKQKIGGFNRLFCRTYSGPWTAEIAVTEDCDNACGEGTHDFVMTIPGVPGNLFWRWKDSMDKHPKEFQISGEPWVKSYYIIDCNPLDQTNCGGIDNSGGGYIPAKGEAEKKK